MMWSWKLIYEDETFNLYCDIDNVVGSEELDEGMFAAVDCYRSLPKRLLCGYQSGLRTRVSSRTT